MQLYHCISKDGDLRLSRSKLSEKHLFAEIWLFLAKPYRVRTDWVRERLKTDMVYNLLLVETGIGYFLKCVNGGPQHYSIIFCKIGKFGKDGEKSSRWQVTFLKSADTQSVDVSVARSNGRSRRPRDGNTHRSST